MVFVAFSDLLLLTRCVGCLFGVVGLFFVFTVCLVLMVFC